MNTIFILLIYIFFLFLIFFTLYRFIMQKFNLLEVNYRGQWIPVSTGIILPFVFIGVYPILDLISSSNVERYFTYLQLTMIISLIGLLDDLIGNKQIKGLKGHIINLIYHKRISTGLVKMMSIIMIGTSIGLQYDNKLIDFVLDIPLFAIWTNILNLFDVRPCRSIKFFWILSFIFLILFFEQYGELEWILFLLTYLLFEIDRKEWGMLGDAGANLLGGIIGLWMVMWGTTFEKILFLLIGVWITYYAERYSISVWIKKYPMTNWIDHWGRKAYD